MNSTDTSIRDLLAALPAPGYDIGVRTDGSMYRVEAAPASRILRMLPFLEHRNAQGAHIYLRPTGESCYTLLDDLTAATLPRLTVEGYAPAAVVETSPGSFQAWLRHTQPFHKELAPLPRKLLLSSSAQIAAPPIGAGSVVPPASPTASRSTATGRASTRSPIFALLPEQSSPKPTPSAPDCSRSSKRQKLNAPPCVSASQPSPSVGTPRPSRSHASVRRRTTMDGQPPQIWPSASPPSLKAGPSPTSPPHSAANTSPATTAAHVKPLTSAARFPKRSNG